MPGLAGERAELRVRLLTMRALARIAKRRLAAEQGFTLAELMVAMGLGLLVVSAGTIMFTTAIRGESGLAGRERALQDGRLAMDRMIREIRQGGSVIGTPTATSLTFATFVANSSVCTGSGSDQYVHKPCNVTYSCASGTCTRREQNPYTGTQGPAVTVVRGLATSNVFEYWSDPSTECQPPPTVAKEAVSIRDEATLRNSDPTSLGRVCVSFVFPKAFR
jgi:prepilin-type N-terminal cleavage/methylation domain-containing protein